MLVHSGKSRWLLIHAPVVVIVGLLAACRKESSIPGTNSVTDLQISGTARGWTGSTAVLRALGTNREEKYFVSLGSIAPNGDFTLELPQPPGVPDSFGPLTCEAGETNNLEVTPSTLIVTLVERIGVTETHDLDNPEMGEVVHIKGDPAGNEDSTRGMYAYASVPGTVKGTCVRVDKTSVRNFNLTLAAGWNHVVVTFTNPTTDFVATYRTTALPGDLNWTYYEFPPPPPPSEPAAPN